MGGGSAARRRTQRLVEGVTRATIRLLQGTDWDSSVADALPILGEAIGVDRVYIYEHLAGPDSPRPLVRLRFSWPRRLRPETPIEIPYVELGFGSWYERLAAGESVQCTHSSLESPARDFLERVGTRAALVVPIRVEDAFWGVVGFDDCHRERRWSAEEEGVLAAAAASLGAALRRARDESALRREVEAIRRHEEQLAALLDVSRAVAGTLDLEEILDAVQRRTAVSLACDATVTFYWDRQRRRYRMIAQHGLSEPMVERLGELELEPEEGVAGLLRDQPVVCLTGDDPFLAELQRRFPISHLLAARLRVRGRLLGGLVAVRGSGTPPFDASQATLFEGIAAQLAVALEAAELYRAQREEAATFRALVEVGRELIRSLSGPDLLDRLCQVTARILECDFAHTWLRDETTEEYHLVAGAGDSPEVFESMRAVRIPEKLVEGLLRRLASDDMVQIIMSEPQDLLPADLPRRYGIRSALYLALRSPSGLRGILTAGHYRRERRFGPQQERIARGVAQLASLALENAALVEALSRANRLKSEFVATISHELRTPLNVIMGYTDLLREGVFGPVTGEQEETLDRIERSARELLDLINTILDLSRLDAGRLPVERRRVRLPEFVTSLEEETGELRAKPGVSYRREIAEDLPELVTDPVKLKVIVKNLLQNAFKFTDRGHVKLRVQKGGPGIEIAVEDTGIGIAPEMREAIFEAFRQAEASLTRRHGGAGLGLYIVRRLVELLGGSVAVESEVGCGSTFLVQLPLRPPGPPEPSDTARP